MQAIPMTLRGAEKLREELDYQIGRASCRERV